MAAGHGQCQEYIDSATMMPTNAATDPTDRSMWPAMITMTMPIASTSTYELPLTMLIMLLGSSVLPVRIWNSTMMTTRAPRMPNWRPLDCAPPNILVRSRKWNPVFSGVGVVEVSLIAG